MFKPGVLCVRPGSVECMCVVCKADCASSQVCKAGVLCIKPGVQCRCVVHQARWVMCQAMQGNYNAGVLCVKPGV